MWPAAMAFFLTGFFLAAATFLGTGLVVLGRAMLAGRIFAWAGAAGVLYASALVAFGLTSQERVLPVGAEKHICEIDCHVAYSVVSASRKDAIGAPALDAAPGHTFLVVTLRVRFDETTISARRGDMPLTPGPRRIKLVDGAGRQYTVSAEAQSALNQSLPSADMLTRDLRPGQSFTTDLVFDVPADAGMLRLSIQDADHLKRLLLGSEISPFHRPTLLELAVVS